jgi:fibro-slime domain-containing protein
LCPTGSQDQDYSNFETAHYRGIFTTTAADTALGFRLGSDDDSWVFVDWKLTIDNGEVKELTTLPYKVTHVSAGSHAIDVFYSDRHSARAELVLSTDFPACASNLHPAELPGLHYAAQRTPARKPTQMPPRR